MQGVACATELLLDSMLDEELDFTELLDATLEEDLTELLKLDEGLDPVDEFVESSLLLRTLLLDLAELLDFALLEDFFLEDELDLPIVGRAHV